MRLTTSYGLNVHDNVFEADTALSGGAIVLTGRDVKSAQYKILNNTFVRCHAESAGAALFVIGEQVEAHEIFVNRNVFVAEGDRSRPQLECDVTGPGATIDSLFCNAFYGTGVVESGVSTSVRVGVAGKNAYERAPLEPDSALAASCPPPLAECGEVGAR
jgi:hypothetical protein